MRILVVEDDRIRAEFIERVLAEEGYPCLIAKNTREADLVLATVAVDGVIANLELAGPVAALDWVEEIVKVLPDLAAHSLVLTGAFPEGRDAERIRELGAGVLLDPFTESELRQAARSSIGGEGMEAGSDRKHPAESGDSASPRPSPRPPQEKTSPDEA